MTARSSKLVPLAVALVALSVSAAPAAATPEPQSDAGCPDVRAALLDAHERGARPSEHAVLHVKGCRECRSYQRDIRRLHRQLHALNPALGLPVVAAIAHLVGGGAKAATAVAAAVAVVATGGVVVLRTDVHSTGDPAPFRLAGLRDENGRPLTTGKPIPGRTAIVTTLVDIPALKAEPRAEQTVTIDCPERMIFLGLVEPMRRAPLDWQITRDTIPGRSTTARLDLSQRDPKRVAKGTIGIICRRPAANGSLYPNPRKLQPGERPAHVCPGRWRVPIFTSPHGMRVHDLDPREPVAIQRRNATGRWTLVAHDYDPRWVRGKEPGWIRTSELCP